MAHFMPFDEQKAVTLNERLAKTIFRSVSDFVNFYNSNLINKQHKDVAAIAGEITSVYRDVKERGKRLVFISEAEVFLNEINATLGLWEVLVKVKRDVQQHIEEGTLEPGDTLVLISKDKGQGYVHVPNEENQLERLSEEKLFGAQADIPAIYAKYSTRKNEEQAEAGQYSFAASDFLQLDDAFIARIKEQLPR